MSTYMPNHRHLLALGMCCLSISVFRNDIDLIYWSRSSLPVTSIYFRRTRGNFLFEIMTL